MTPMTPTNQRQIAECGGLRPRTAKKADADPGAHDQAEQPARQAEPQPPHSATVLPHQDALNRSTQGTTIRPIR